MTRVYGGCIEPGGIDLENDVSVLECPHCGGDAFEADRSPEIEALLDELGL